VDCFRELVKAEGAIAIIIEYLELTRQTNDCSSSTVSQAFSKSLDKDALELWNELRTFYVDKVAAWCCRLQFGVLGMCCSWWLLIVSTSIASTEFLRTLVHCCAQATS
jgi:hypothetical protein